MSVVLWVITAEMDPLVQMLPTFFLVKAGVFFDTPTNNSKSAHAPLQLREKGSRCAMLSSHFLWVNNIWFSLPDPLVIMKEERDRQLDLAQNQRTYDSFESEGHNHFEALKRNSWKCLETVFFAIKSKTNCLSSFEPNDYFWSGYFICFLRVKFFLQTLYNRQDDLWVLWNSNSHQKLEVWSLCLLSTHLRD